MEPSVPAARADVPPIHRWPTEQESVNLLDPLSPQPVTVAAIANSAPYDPTQVTVAQYDDGDVQMGDRVAIVYDRNGVAKAVRDTSGRRDQ